MTEPKSFSIAVLKGASRGRVVRTEKKRIAVGSAQDNDLVLEDPDIPVRHFVVLVDQGRWRIHALSTEKSVSIGSEWIHPSSGARGAFLATGPIELLLCPGDLDEATLRDELKKREVAEKATLPRTSRRVLAGATLPDTRDLIESSQLPTVAAEKPPADLQKAAKSRLQEARGVEPPSVVRERAVRAPDAPTVLEPKVREFNVGLRDKSEFRDAGRSASEAVSALPTRPLPTLGPKPLRRDDTQPDSSVPEVVPEPDAPRALRIAESESSDLTTTPAFDSGPVRKELEAATASGSARTSGGSARNAWGDKVDRFAGQSSALKPVVPVLKNAWGDVRSTPRPKPQQGSTMERLPERILETESSRGGMASAPGFDRGPPLGLPIALEALSQSEDPALTILRDPDGEYATAIRLLGARLEEFMRTLGYRAYMLTSPEPLTGKSTVAANLALALAEDTHRRVALIEANFRYPRFAQIFGAPEDRGLIPLLDGRAQIGDAAVKVTERNLVIIPSGGRHPSPAELLAAPRFKALVAELANTVDIALIDAPSVMPFADANILLPLVDAALFVVTEGRTEAGWMAKACAQIGDARVLGAVYNRIPRSKASRLRREIKLRLKS